METSFLYFLPSLPISRFLWISQYCKVSVSYSVNSSRQLICVPFFKLISDGWSPLPEKDKVNSRAPFKSPKLWEIACVTLETVIILHEQMQKKKTEKRRFILDIVCCCCLFIMTKKYTRTLESEIIKQNCHSSPILQPPRCSVTLDDYTSSHDWVGVYKLCLNDIP